MRREALVKPAAAVRCAVYTRKSSEEGLEQEFNSLHAQRDACEAYVKSQVGEGWGLIPDVYDDGGFSGGSMERPALKRLLADVEARRIDVVVLYKIDRLTRSLTDFTRIVEVFDSAGASFVSVTQAFNTTTSMGRLTLNMLLSFAQFEREVTGERIRDKIAASKAKGMWMGGGVPLGYEPNGRTLKINDVEAALVRHIFDRYLALGSVKALRAELTGDGHLSKVNVFKSGRRRGGVQFSRGAVFHLLSNPLYLGQIPHRGKTYPGLHAAIVDPETFEAVRQRLAANAGPKRRAEVGLKPLAPATPLTGLIRDDRDHPMSPVCARGRRGQIYRYYVSKVLQVGSHEKAGSVPRFPAQPLEALILDRARRLIGLHNEQDPWPQIRAAIERVEVARGHIQVLFRRAAFGSGRLDIGLLKLGLPDSDELRPEGEVLALTVDVSLRSRGGAKFVTGPGGGAALETKQVDLVLLRALIRAEAWKRQLASGAAPTLKVIADQEGLQPGHIQRLLRLAFLSPDLKRAILRGRAPVGLTLQRIMEQGLPDLWAQQQATACG